MNEEEKKNPEETGQQTEWMNRMAEMEKTHKEALDKVRLEGEVRFALARKGVKNAALAAKAVDLSAVQVTDEGIVGVEEAVCRLAESDPYLFGQETPGQNGSQSGRKLTIGETSTGAVHGTAAKDPDAMSDAEYYKTVRGL